MFFPAGLGRFSRWCSKVVATLCLSVVLALGAGSGHAKALVCSVVAGDRALLGSWNAAFEGNLNRMRARNGLKPLTASPTLRRIATRYARLLGRTGHFDHTGPDDSTMSERLRAGGYKACLAAENLAYGTFESAEQLFNGWMSSAGHRQNMMLRDVVEYGLGLGCTRQAATLHGAPGPEVTYSRMPGASGSVRPYLASADRASLSPRIFYFVFLAARPCR